MAVRQKKAADKKETLEIEKQEKELLKKQRVKKLKKLKEEVEEGEPVAPPPAAPIKKESSGVDVERAVLEGITKYELIRKQRKKEKREQEARDKEEDMVRETLRRAVAPVQKPYNPFDGICY
jgi:hypothetical protein